MFKSFKIIVFCSLLAFSGLSWSADYGRASNIESALQGHVVARYIKEYGSFRTRVNMRLFPSLNQKLTTGGMPTHP